MVMMRRLLERRSKNRRWTYILCGVVALLFGILSAGMGDDFLGLLPYLIIAAVCHSILADDSSRVVTADRGIRGIHSYSPAKLSTTCA